MPLFAMPITPGADAKIPFSIVAAAAATNTLLLAVNEPGKQAALGSWNQERQVYMLTLNVACPEFASLAWRYFEVFRQSPLLMAPREEARALPGATMVEALDGETWRMATSPLIRLN